MRTPRLRVLKEELLLVRLLDLQTRGIIGWTALVSDQSTHLMIGHVSLSLTAVAIGFRWGWTVGRGLHLSGLVTWKQRLSHHVLELYSSTDYILRVPSTMY